MPNALTTNVSLGLGGISKALQIVVLFAALAVLVVVVYAYYVRAPVCDTSIERGADGSLTMKPSGRVFASLNDFQQWFHSSGTVNVCPLPVLTGKGESEGKGEEGVVGDLWSTEQTFATTPIYKVDDYEFSRVFGYERAGHMDVPRQNFNMILENRTFDWADRPMTSDERRGKYAGLREGFTAAGNLESVPVVPVVPVGKEKEKASSTKKEAATPEGLRDYAREAAAKWTPPAATNDADCKAGRETKEVAKLVAHAYEGEPDWEPVVTKVGPNQWEVNELKPRRRQGVISDAVDDSVVDTNNDAVDISFHYREREVQDAAIDPYFAGLGSLPYDHERSRTADPFYGPVPGMERMFGPTFDKAKWY